ncbi:MAG: 2TM domain-containing protein [Clostridiales bacterium]|jgi:hypothetical protein|nr:2TM domain-containing protein [Clostridiales bacterium]
MSDEVLLKLARKRAKAKVGFRAHATSFVAVNVFLVLVYLVSGAGYFWPIWSLLGWGLGLLMHGITVHTSLFSNNYEDEVQAEYQKLKNKSFDAHYDSYEAEKDPRAN